MPDSPRRAQGLVAARPVPGHRVRISVAVLAGVAAGIAIAAVAAAHSAAVGAVADQADAAGMTAASDPVSMGIAGGFTAANIVAGLLSIVSAWKLRDDNGGVSRLAGQLLPAAVRDDYVEEWQAWLNDLHAASEPWHRRLAELLSIVLIAAPRLAVTLRLRRRVVD